MAATPPPQSEIHTPPTPLHGVKYDNWEPYTTTRKSTRFLTQRGARTPSPDVSLTAQKTASSTASSRSKKTPIARSSAHTFSPPSSAQASPQKRTRKDMALASAPKQDDEPHTEGKVQSHNVASTTLSLNPSMLPTPAKTPRKKVIQPTSTSTARVLFPSRLDNLDDSMLTPTKHGRRGKKHGGFSLSFADDDASSNGKVEIYTDSKDKIPEIDESSDNPFYVKPGSERSATKNGNKRRKVSNLPHHDEGVQEMLKRNEGMVYVFRGKKIYRKFDLDPEDIEETTNGHRPVTRSAIKPRLLFPGNNTPKTAPPDAEIDEDEEAEAVTDIEDPHAHDSEMTEVAPESEEEPLVTPVKISFTPSSPPTTGRTTRSSTRKSALDSSPLTSDPVDPVPRFTIKRGRASSPFRDWQHPTTGSAESGKRRKRARGSSDRNGAAVQTAKGGTV